MYANFVLFILYSALPSAVLLLAFFVMYFDSESELPRRFQIGGKTTLPFRKTYKFAFHQKVEERAKILTLVNLLLKKKCRTDMKLKD